ncbi:hypothetical protein PFTANZ_01909 [Plasmodium falciparum Tanzania (2000708)]|uniref:RRM domain-containing protein n=1 Tax=Plasmodium falciparum Tanzania (2000708) TaxID=1036725 RepID=A0A024WA12_PLAFA|nr:hypothetical protein PFTANZ_01909 [Plasmodium falciparum Tanzania (2000708)]
MWGLVKSASKKNINNEDTNNDETIDYDEEGEEEKKNVTNNINGNTNVDESKYEDTLKDEKGNVMDVDKDDMENTECILNSDEINKKIENLLNNLSSDEEEEGEVVEDEIPYERVNEKNKENKEIILLNIYLELSNDHLEMLLKIFGTIEKIYMDDNEGVHAIYTSLSSAKKAKEFLDNLKIKNRRMQVIYGNYKKNSNMNNVDNKRNTHIYNMNNEYMEENINNDHIYLNNYVNKDRNNKHELYFKHYNENSNILYDHLGNPIKKNVVLYKNKKYYMNNMKINNNSPLYKNHHMKGKNVLLKNNMFDSSLPIHLNNDYMMTSDGHMKIADVNIANNNDQQDIPDHFHHSNHFSHIPPPPPPTSLYNNNNDNNNDNDNNNNNNITNSHMGEYNDNHSDEDNNNNNNNFSYNNSRVNTNNSAYRGKNNNMQNEKNNYNKLIYNKYINVPNDNIGNNFLHSKYNSNNNNNNNNNYESFATSNYNFSYQKNNLSSHNNNNNNNNYSKGLYSKHIPPPPFNEHNNFTTLSMSNINMKNKKENSNFINSHNDNDNKDNSLYNINEFIEINDNNPFNIHSEHIMNDNFLWITRKEEKVLNWSTHLSIEENHLDFLQSFNIYKLYNRYLLITNIPTNLRDPHKLKDYINNLLTIDKKYNACVDVTFFDDVKNNNQTLFYHDDINKDTQHVLNTQEQKEEHINSEQNIKQEGNTDEQEHIQSDHHDDKSNGNNEEPVELKEEEITQKCGRTKGQERAKAAPQKLRNMSGRAKTKKEEQQEQQEEQQEHPEGEQNDDNVENEKNDPNDDSHNNDVSDWIDKNDVNKNVYAHLTFRTIKNCTEAKKILEEKNFLVTYTSPHKPNNCLWVGNILKNYFFNTANILKTMFSYFGEIRNIKYVNDKNCFFLQYKNVESAINARNHMFGIQISKSTILNIDFSILNEWENKQKINLSRKRFLDNNETQDRLEKKYHRKNNPYADSKTMSLLKRNRYKKGYATTNSNNYYNNKYDDHNSKKKIHKDSNYLIDKKNNHTRKSKSYKSSYHEKSDNQKILKRKTDDHEHYRDSKKNKRDYLDDHKHNYNDDNMFNDQHNSIHTDMEHDNSVDGKKEKIIAFYVNQKYKCDFVATLYEGDPKLKIYSKLNVETKSDIKNLKQIKSTCTNYAIWKLGPTPSQTKKFTHICDHFSKKKNIPVIINKECTIFIVPIKEEYLKDLQIENMEYMYAYVLETKKT